MTQKEFYLKMQTLNCEYTTRSNELYIPPQRPKPLPYNPTNGQFVKGIVPHNKGKKWDDFMPKRSQRRAAKGWKNLDKYRPTTRPDTAGRCRKQVVALMDGGGFHVFPYIGAAAEWLKRTTGESCNRENIGRCCRENASRRPLQRPWGNRNGKAADIQPNTDHRYKGIRWYFEKDAVWLGKVKQQ